MKMKNSEIDGLKTFILSFHLNHSDTRKRGKFIKLLDEQLAYINCAKLELIQHYGKKDEHGHIISRIENNQQVYDLEDAHTFRAEIAKLLNEDFALDNTNERRDALLFIRNLILQPPDTNRQFAGQDAIDYERWCEIAETIEYEEDHE